MLLSAVCRSTGHVLATNAALSIEEWHDDDDSLNYILLNTVLRLCLFYGVLSNGLEMIRQGDLPKTCHCYNSHHLFGIGRDTRRRPAAIQYSVCESHRRVQRESPDDVTRRDRGQLSRQSASSQRITWLESTALQNYRYCTNLISTSSVQDGNISLKLKACTYNKQTIAKWRESVEQNRPYSFGKHTELCLYSAGVP